MAVRRYCRGGFSTGASMDFMGGPARWRGKEGKEGKREREGVERPQFRGLAVAKASVWSCTEGRGLEALETLVLQPSVAAYALAVLFRLTGAG